MDKLRPHESPEATSPLMDSAATFSAENSSFFQMSAVHRAGGKPLTSFTEDTNATLSEPTTSNAPGAFIDPALALAGSQPWKPPTIHNQEVVENRGTGTSFHQPNGDSVFRRENLIS